MQAMLLAVLCAVGMVVQAQETAQETSWDRLHKAADQYVSSRTADPKEAAKWDRKFQSRVESRAEATRLSADAAAQSVVLDWLTDKEEALRAKRDAEILEACRIFCWLYRRKIELPTVVRVKMADEGAMDRFANWLTENAVTVASSQPRTD